MNYSTAVFLINDKVRAVSCTYEVGDKAPRETFKTLDATIQVGDFLIVPTGTRHNMTVVKVVDTDVDVDFDASALMEWVIAKINRSEYEEMLKVEASAVAQIKSAEVRKKRDELREALFKDQSEMLKALPLASAGGDPAA